MLLRNLGDFQTDKYQSVRENGWGENSIEYMASKLPSYPVRKACGVIIFQGGPMGHVLFKGTLSHMIADRCLLVSCEKGQGYVDTCFEYAKGVCSVC